MMDNYMDKQESDGSDSDDMIKKASTIVDNPLH